MRESLVEILSESEETRRSESVNLPNYFFRMSLRIEIKEERSDDLIEEPKDEEKSTSVCQSVRHGRRFFYYSWILYAANSALAFRFEVHGNEAPFGVIPRWGSTTLFTDKSFYFDLHVFSADLYHWSLTVMLRYLAGFYLLPTI